MITHRNIVSNVQQINKCYDFNEEDVFLSFLPFSHTFERTVAHYNSLANGRRHGLRPQRRRRSRTTCAK